jgi:glutathione S-transferase
MLRTAYGIIEKDMATRTWALGDLFTMADCAAAPALYYANLVEPFADHEAVARYFARLIARPSFARAVKEADPYRGLFPNE